jgi:hypothetical protein
MISGEHHPCEAQATQAIIVLIDYMDLYILALRFKSGGLRKLEKFDKIGAVQKPIGARRY